MLGYGFAGIFMHNLVNSCHVVSFHAIRCIILQGIAMEKVEGYSGHKYNISRVLNEKDLTFNQKDYDNQWGAHLPPSPLLSLCLYFFMEDGAIIAEESTSARDADGHEIVPAGNEPTSTRDADGHEIVPAGNEPTSARDADGHEIVPAGNEPTSTRDADGHEIVPAGNEPTSTRDADGHEIVPAGNEPTSARDADGHEIVPAGNEPTSAKDADNHEIVPAGNEPTSARDVDGKTNDSSDQEKKEETNDESPITEVRLNVPTTDNPLLPTLTFRTWVIGIIYCIITASSTQLFNYRQNNIFISRNFINMLVITLGKLMEKFFPSTLVKVPGTAWTFSLNPGPFDIKENVLTAMLATSGLDNPYGNVVAPIMKIFYKKSVNFWPALLVTQTSQMLGYGFAGIFMKFPVHSPYMWFPKVLPDVSFYSAMHGVELRSEGQLTKLQFFYVVAALSFSYAVIPGYYFPSIGAISLICLVRSKSVIANLIGSGRNGFGIASFSMDWSTISGLLGNPLETPLSTIINTMMGFIFFLYIITPIFYSTNTFNAKHFPLSSSELFDYSGREYNISRVINGNNLTLNQEAYESYSKINFSTVFLLSTGCSFAMISSIITQFILFHGRDMCRQIKQAWKNEPMTEDIHNKLMKNYRSIPIWWFIAILVSMTGLGIFSCEGFQKQLQLSYWGMLVTCLYVIILILPLGVLQATTGQDVLPNNIPQLVMGYLYPGRPIANLVSKAYGVSTMFHALNFTSQMKLGHYMKIPPRTMFATQLIGTLISSFISFSMSWLLISTVPSICDTEKLPEGSPWTCPGEHLAYDRSVMWGLIGPSELFYPQGQYSMLYYFLLGILASLLVWGFSKFFPRQKWIQSVNIPCMFQGAMPMAIAGSVTYWSWGIVGVGFNLIFHRRYKGRLASYNYLLGNGLDIGVGLFSILNSVTLHLFNIYGIKWWGLAVADHCPLAKCPTAPGVRVDGCPTF